MKSILELEKIALMYSSKTSGTESHELLISMLHTYQFFKYWSVI